MKEYVLINEISYTIFSILRLYALFKRKIAVLNLGNFMVVGDTNIHTVEHLKLLLYRLFGMIWRLVFDV
jgi:hypothetical protein